MRLSRVVALGVVALLLLSLVAVATGGTRWFTSASAQQAPTVTVDVAGDGSYTVTLNGIPGGYYYPIDYTVSNASGIVDQATSIGAYGPPLSYGFGSQPDGTYAASVSARCYDARDTCGPIGTLFTASTTFEIATATPTPTNTATPTEVPPTATATATTEPTATATATATATTPPTATATTQPTATATSEPTATATTVPTATATATATTQPTAGPTMRPTPRPRTTATVPATATSSVPTVRPTARPRG